MRAWISMALLFAAFLGGCTVTHNVKMEPIHMTLDINLKVDRQLDDFFDFEDEFDDTETDEEGGR